MYFAIATCLVMRLFTRSVVHAPERLREMMVARRAVFSGNVEWVHPMTSTGSTNTRISKDVEGAADKRGEEECTLASLILLSSGGGAK